MNEDDARRLLLVRSFETPVTPPWTAADAAWAGDEARRAVGEHAGAEAWLVARARVAVQRLGERLSALPRVLQAATWPAWLGGTVIALALLAGVASDAIGPSLRINILAPPLLALLAWNLAVYLLLAVGHLRARAAGGDVAAPGVLTRALGHLVERAGAPRRAGPAAGALARFAASWSAATRGLQVARLAALLHTAAAALAIGALGSLYLRGLAFEFRAGWDSTFLDATAVERLLHVVLGPAAALTGLPLPDADALAPLRFAAGGGENAAHWIHLYALTLGLAVVLPRAALAAAAAWRARRLARDLPLPLDEPYYRRLLPLDAASARPLQVVPYSYRIDASQRQALLALLERGLGPLRLAVAESVPLGSEDQPDALPARTPPEARVAALFALTATPERETHGRFVALLAAQGGGAAPPLVLVDESGFRERFGASDGAERQAQRRQAWQAMLGEAGRHAVFVDLACPDLEAAEIAFTRERR